MNLIHYPACGCRLEVLPADTREETRYAANGETCPRCRATNPNDVTLSRLAAQRLGRVKSARKAEAARENGAKGGRPKKTVGQQQAGTGPAVGDEGR